MQPDKRIQECILAAFDLLTFSPFRLNRLAAEISLELSSVYTDQFQISIIEWRILATLESEGSCSAQRIVDSTRTHKSRISRGVTRLVERQLIERLEHVSDDRRQVRLRLTRKGRAHHKKVVPVVLEKERHILSCLSDKEQREFFCTLEKLETSLNLINRDDEERN